MQSALLVLLMLMVVVQVLCRRGWAVLASIFTPRERRRTQETEAGFESVEGKGKDKRASLFLAVCLWVCLWLLGERARQTQVHKGRAFWK